MKSHFYRRAAAALLYTGIFCATSCVPTRQYEEMKGKEAACQDEKTKLQGQNLELTTQLTELEGRYKILDESATGLRADTTNMGEAQRQLTEKHTELTRDYEKLLVNHKSLMAGNAAETRRLIARLDSAQESLQREQDNMEAQRRQLVTMEKDLMEMKRTLAQRDSVATALKNAVSKALMGFENNGLTIEKRNGMVYVSMEERLLFASGSTVVDKKGVEALEELAGVLAKNKDISITVEGHTDNVPITGGPIKDNWDLSVLRATEVVKIITRNKGVEASRISAAGRGPFMPIDRAGTAEAKKKNRRTEIILNPSFGELMKVVETR